jgi:hypothetical protein
MSTTTRFIPTGSTASIIKVFGVHAVVAIVAILGVLTVVADTLSLGQSALLWLLALVIFGVQPLATVMAYQRFMEE